MVENFVALFGNKWDAPCEEVHEVGEQVGVGTLDKLLDVEGVILHERRSTSNLMTAPLLL